MARRPPVPRQIVNDENVVFLRQQTQDTMQSLLTGLGIMGRDKVTSTEYVHNDLDITHLEEAYRGNWIARKIVDIPAKDSTRMWRDWEAKPDQIELLEETERKLHIKQKMRQGLIWARLYGGAALILGTDDGAD